ncbi:MAG TPA: PP2C family protein-serine/threonine phosphatase, partial [Trebonia sp.]
GPARLVGEPGSLLGVLPALDLPASVVDLGAGDRLLLYTDGVTEARDASREFYPLDERVRALAPQAQPRLTRSGRVRGNDSETALLDLVREDLLSYVGAPPDDDAALLLIRAPAAWPGARPARGAGR